jgi:DUF1680 family protein
MPETSLALEMDHPENFAIYLRVPAWAGPRTRVAVNGKAAPEVLKPGTFASIKRTWKSGDRIELTFDMPMQLESVDPQHPKDVALLQGPVALFAVGELPQSFTRKDLLAAKQTAPGSSEWQAGSVRMKSYPAIQSEHYRLYLPVTS